jgi:hypothetical protein
MNTQEYLAIKRERIRKRFGDVLPLVNLSPAVVEDLVPLLEQNEADQQYIASTWDSLHYSYERIREERDALQQRVDRLEALLVSIQEGLDAARTSLLVGRRARSFIIDDTEPFVELSQEEKDRLEKWFRDNLYSGAEIAVTEVKSNWGVDPGAPKGDYTVIQYIDVEQYRKWGEADGLP